ncbi:Signal transduction histidine kinase [Duganella sp. CF458]|uniref:sensor histidine kinase n=1 Tax=Duganella sp. CF458 TaxID=1884368 RepID=UPI0008E02EFD|nr:HAMP domain-containing sensor histidine kinase [Duganella sp. CF458]SFF81698.1 Signal transduction histidine kinase [Duganella sp. CF458]
MTAQHSLRRRLASAFALIALCTALLFSGFAVVFMYALEDEFFANLLAQETAHQQASWRESAALAPPLRPFVSVHRDEASLPPDLRRQPGVARGGEFFGDGGRHYHVRQLALPAAPPMLLVAEVGTELLVRPRLPKVLGLLGGSLLAILALTVGLGYWLAWRATRPLNTLAQLVGGAAPGHLPQGFAEAFPHNEIGALARALDDAMSRTAAFIEREQHFTRDASHELRTPLAVIEGAAYLLAEQPMPSLASEQLQRIRSAATHMAQTVDLLLALAREDLAQEGSANPPLQPVRLLPLAESTVVQMAHLLDGKPVSVEVDIGQAAHFCVPQPALAVVLSNIVGNAFQHSQRGCVRITFDGVRLTVSDEGPGLEDAIRTRLFEAGVKGGNSRGHGLGLSIARRLAERIGLELSLEPGAQGGTVATLTPRK